MRVNGWREMRENRGKNQKCRRGDYNVDGRDNQHQRKRDCKDNHEIV